MRDFFLPSAFLSLGIHGHADSFRNMTKARVLSEDSGVFSISDDTEAFYIETNEFIRFLHVFYLWGRIFAISLRDYRFYAMIPL